MLITEKYRQLNRDLHESRPDYGSHGNKWAQTVAQMAREWDATSILDYGCGKRTLETALGFSITNYDPAIEGLDAPPEPCDIVACTDVLEHIEPDCIDAVLDDIQRVTLKGALLVIATRPAKKTLADGRNAHLIQEDIAWWLPKIMARFTLVQVNNMGGEFLAIVRSKA